jgi:hypothetical protein
MHNVRASAAHAVCTCATHSGRASCTRLQASTCAAHASECPPKLDTTRQRLEPAHSRDPLSSNEVALSKGMPFERGSAVILTEPLADCPIQEQAKEKQEAMTSASHSVSLARHYDRTPPPQQSHVGVRMCLKTCMHASVHSLRASVRVRLCMHKWEHACAHILRVHVCKPPCIHMCGCEYAHGMLWPCEHPRRMVCIMGVRAFCMRAFVHARMHTGFHEIMRACIPVLDCVDACIHGCASTKALQYTTAKKVNHSDEEHTAGRRRQPPKHRKQ